MIINIGKVVFEPGDLPTRQSVNQPRQNPTEDTYANPELRMSRHQSFGNPLLLGVIN
jgi:hypothetical protein